MRHNFKRRRMLQQQRHTTRNHPVSDGAINLPNDANLLANGRRERQRVKQS
jgi:hypothetical protein